MQKNKLWLLFLLIPVTVSALITHEQFKTLSDDEKWEIYLQHISNYRRIFKEKNAVIFKHENAERWWQNVAITSMVLQRLHLYLE